MQYPVNLNLGGRPVLVVGGGRIAARKIAGLLSCGAEITVVAPEVVPEIESMAVKVERRRYERGDVRGYRLAVTATDDPDVNRAVFVDGEVHGIWVNSADDPVNCSFTLPAVFRRGPVMVTTSTGGAAPGLSSWLRRTLEEQIGPEFAEVAARLAAARARVHAEGGSTEELDWAPVIERELADVRAERAAQEPAGP